MPRQTLIMNKEREGMQQLLLMKNLPVRKGLQECRETQNNRKYILGNVLALHQKKT